MTENAVWFTKRVRAGGLRRTKQRYLQSHLTLDKSAVTHLSPLQQRCASSEHAHISAAGVCAGSASKQVHLFLFSSTVQPNTRLKTLPRRPARLFRISSPCRWEECDVLLYEWERGKKRRAVFKVSFCLNVQTSFTGIQQDKDIPDSSASSTESKTAHSSAFILAQNNSANVLRRVLRAGLRTGHTALQTYSTPWMKMLTQSAVAMPSKEVPTDWLQEIHQAGMISTFRGKCPTSVSSLSGQINSLTWQHCHGFKCAHMSNLELPTTRVSVVGQEMKFLSEKWCQDKKNVFIFPHRGLKRKTDDICHLAACAWYDSWQALFNESKTSHSVDFGGIQHNSYEFVRVKRREVGSPHSRNCIESLSSHQSGTNLSAGRTGTVTLYLIFQLLLERRVKSSYSSSSLGCLL